MSFQGQIKQQYEKLLVNTHYYFPYEFKETLKNYINLIANFDLLPASLISQNLERVCYSCKKLSIAFSNFNFTVAKILHHFPQQTETINFFYRKLRKQTNRKGHHLLIQNPFLHIYTARLHSKVHVTALSNWMSQVLKKMVFSFQKSWILHLRNLIFKIINSVFFLIAFGIPAFRMHLGHVFTLFCEAKRKRN